MFKKMWAVLLLVLMLAGATGCQTQISEQEKQVNEAIEAFLDDYVSNYLSVNGETIVIDYYVASAIYLLEQSGYDVNINDYLSDSQAQTFIDQLDYTSATNIFKALVIAKAFDIEANLAIDALEALETVDVWSYAYVLIALNMTNVNPTLKQTILADINVIRTEDYRDADFAAIALMATTNQSLDQQPFHTLINEALTKDGIFAWGQANAASTANVIIGLIALGSDPTSEDYTTEGVHLVSALFAYETEGAFANYLDDELDLAYATPQGFAALVVYKLFLKNNTAIALFS